MIGWLGSDFQKERSYSPLNVKKPTGFGFTKF